MKVAIILSGGFGARLKSISKGIPKTLMPIGNSVCLDFLLNKIFKYKINHIFLNLLFKTELVNEYIVNSIYKERLTTIIVPKPLGTRGDC